MDRLTRMDLGMESNNHQHQRGLFDIGGVLLHGLFGLATNKQIRKYRSIIKKLRANTVEIMHVVPELITVVNQTRQYVKANRVKLIDLQAHQA